MYIGAHLSISKGFRAIVEEAKSIDANTFAFFLRNPRGGAAKTIDARDVAEARELMAAQGFGRLVAHAPYVLNPCAAKPELRAFARETMIDDLHRLAALPGNYYNFHPGCHVGQGADAGIALTTEFLREVLPEAGETTVLIEAMAGKGTEIGRTFDELARMYDGVGDASRLGVCLDTCHIWDGGYDVAEHLDDVIGAFDAAVGIDHLRAIHLNDSMNALGAHKDRHARIGEGHIGFEALLRVVKHPKLAGLPFILETPNDIDGYRREIAMFRARN